MPYNIFSRTLFGADLKPGLKGQEVALEVIEYESLPMQLSGIEDFSALRGKPDPWADTQIDFI